MNANSNFVNSIVILVKLRLFLYRSNKHN